MRNDTRRNPLYDGLPAYDDAVDNNALDSGDDQRIVGLQVGLGRIGAVGDLDNPIAVADIGRNHKGCAHPSGIISGEVGSDHLTVTTHGDHGGAEREVGTDYGDTSLSPAADIRCDLHCDIWFLKDCVRADIFLLGPVGLFDQGILRAGKQHQTFLDQRVTCALVDFEQVGYGGSAIRPHKLTCAINPGAPFAVINI